MAGFFFTGQEDAALTPETIARRRLLLDSLRKGNLSTAPVGHWTQALARVVGSAADTFEENRLNTAEAKGIKEGKSALAAALGIGAGVSPAAAPTAAGASPPSAPAATPVAPQAGSPASPNIMGALKSAFAKVESDGSGGYAAVGPVTRSGDRAYGKYQVMGANIPQWTKEALGYSMTPAEFRASPEAQEKVFEARMGGYLNKYGNVNDAASMWFSGRPMAAAGNASDGYNTVPQYVAKINAALKSGTPAPAAQEAQFNVPGQAQTPAAQNYASILAAKPSGVNTNALLTALSNPWAARSPALAAVAQGVLSKELGRNSVDDALARVKLAQGIQELQSPKPIEIMQNGEKVSVIRQGNNWVPVQVQGGQQAATFTAPDGRVLPLPTEKKAREAFLAEAGKKSADTVLNAPAIVDAAKNTIATIDQILGPRDKATGKYSLHPGAKNVVGSVWQYVPSAPGSEAANFDAIMEQIKGKAFLSAFESLKGGGAITEIEGQKATQAIARLNTKQSKDEFAKSLLELREIVGKGLARAQAAQGGGAAPSAAPQSGGGWTELAPGVRIREVR